MFLIFRAFYNEQNIEIYILKELQFILKSVKAEPNLTTVLVTAERKQLSECGNRSQEVCDPVLSHMFRELLGGVKSDAVHLFV